MDDDFMETKSGLVPLANGWWLDRVTGNKLSPSGIIYDTEGNPIGETAYDSDDDPEYR